MEPFGVKMNHLRQAYSLLILGWLVASNRVLYFLQDKAEHSPNYYVIYLTFAPMLLGITDWAVALGYYLHKRS
jgi:hypothetical protein